MNSYTYGQAFPIFDYSPGFVSTFDLCIDGTNFNKPFEYLIKHHSQDFMSFIRSAYQAKEQLSDSEFCRLNHIPSGVLKKWLSNR